MRALPSRRIVLGAFLALVAAGLFWALLGRATATSVKLLVVGYGTNEVGAFAIVRLTNTGPRSIAYLGEEANQPYYSYSFDTPAGATNYLPFSDARPEKHVLGARKSVEFKAQMMARCPYRITLWYGLTSPLDRLDNVDWNIPPRWVRWVAYRLRRQGHWPVSTPPL